MSLNLMDMLQGNLSEGLIDQLSGQLGGADKKQTAAATEGIMTTLMGALAKNASTPEGASSLYNALEKDHDGGVLEDMMGLFQGNVKPEQARAANGMGILKHLLGDKQSGAVDMISNLSGLDSGKTGNLMSLLAPMLMGTLGKAKKQNGLDIGGIASLLTNSVSTQKSNNNPTMNLVTSFLDKDGDGSIVDDVSKIGFKFLGGLFGRKKR
jgi:hypothetical protein